MAPIRQMTYDTVGGEVETTTFSRLRALNDGGTQRADFHVLGFVHTGGGAVSVDFATYGLEPGHTIWIKPGAVHRWDDITTLHGDLVLFTPTAPVTPTSRALTVTAGEHVAVWQVPDAIRPLVRAAVGHLRLETELPDAQRVPEIPSILLSCLLGRIAPESPPASGRQLVFSAFRDAVETHYRQHHDVQFYADLLGYSARTLSRAAQNHTGASAKAYITARIVLEAKRLLAHDRLPAARCAANLGFSDPSNFSLLFNATVGQRPGRWQSCAS